MIATVTLNPAIDIRYNLSGFQKGQVNRVSSLDKTIGGKGLNVSRVLSQLGADVICTGFLGGKSGEWIADQLSHGKLIDRFVAIEGETRSCLAILSENEQTEILEKGPYLLENEIAAFLEIYESILEKAEYVIVSGSLPRGIEADFYQILAEKANRKRKYLLMDASGIVLEKGITGKPFLIKPNMEEFKQLVGLEHLTIDQMIRHAKSICRNGVQYVLLSLGQEGAILVSNAIILQASIPKVKVINPVGSGDSMLAGFTYAHSKGFLIESALKWACACGISNAVSEKTGSINISQVNRFAEDIKVIELRVGD
jgi:tagatose 6-phosphate kinase